MKINTKIDEQMYPIYHLKATWSEAYLPGVEQRVRLNMSPLPEGRFWNGLEKYLMEKGECTEKFLEERLCKEWWLKYLESRKPLDPADLIIKAEFLEWDSWCSGWFQHWTFDIGLSDAEVLVSFERYVSRLESSNRADKSSLLMGAEDRFRWCGTEDGEPDSHTDPPCRCKYCKEQGIVRIGH